MGLTLKVLVMDDTPRAALISIQRSLEPIAASRDYSNAPRLATWSISLANLSFTVEFEFFQGSIAEARALFGERDYLNQYHLILLDNDWEKAGGQQPGTDGLDLLRDSFQAGIRHPYIVIYTEASGYKADYILSALNHGARALIWKSEATHFVNVILAAVNELRLREEISTLTQRVGDLQEKRQGFVEALTRAEPRLNTKSQAMKDCLVDAARYAITPDIPVILVGSTGSGKEVLARAMHRVSPNRDKIFEVLDCTTVTTELAESVLFGHEKGSFTGAHSQRQGVFEIADGGTLFIDEVDALSLDLQRKLLRVTESGEYRRVGGVRILKSSCRLIIATNKDLYQMVLKGSFLPDLFQRLNFGSIRIPSLNERREDIIDLAEYFLNEFSERHVQPKLTLTDEAREILRNHDWEFGIRELRATIFRSAIKCDADTIGSHEIVFDTLSGKVHNLPPALAAAEISNLIAAAPRTGSQRRILDVLLKKYPNWATYDELHEALGQSAIGEAASGSLMTAVSRLNGLLGRFSLKAESDKAEKAYRLVEC